MYALKNAVEGTDGLGGTIHVLENIRTRTGEKKFGAAAWAPPEQCLKLWTSLSSERMNGKQGDPMLGVKL
jgi:hypothetical protein